MEFMSLEESIAAYEAKLAAHPWRHRWIRLKYIVTHKWPWWFLHRFHPTHRYHVIRTGLKPGWVDVDYLMGHLLVKLFVDFIEQEKPFEHFNTEESPNAEGWIKVKALYDYFKAHPFDELEDACNDYRIDIDEREARSADLTDKLCEIIRLRRFYWT